MPDMSGKEASTPLEAYASQVSTPPAEISPAPYLFPISKAYRGHQLGWRRSPEFDDSQGLCISAH